jgi:hypothetical protein
MQVIFSRISNKEIGGAIQSLSILLLIVFYVTGNIQFEGIHQLIHAHKTAVATEHSTEQEKDPCHRSIHHGDKEKGCNHHSHILFADKCDLCDVIFYGDQELLPVFERTDITFVCNAYINQSFALVSPANKSRSARAPPII